MTRVMKSPNMMSTIGRMPVIAAPTPMPAKPGSEIGVSMMRPVPNSSTRPFSTLNVVPASATSSPIRTMRWSRRISSAIASRIASPNEISRTAVAVSGIDVLGDLARIRIGRVDRELDGLIHLRHELPLDLLEDSAIGGALLQQPRRVQRDRIALAAPLLFFGLRTVIGAGNVADVMAVIAVGVQLQERRAV